MATKHKAEDYYFSSVQNYAGLQKDVGAMQYGEYTCLDKDLLYIENKEYQMNK